MTFSLKYCALDISTRLLLDKNKYLTISQFVSQSNFSPRNTLILLVIWINVLKTF